MSLSCMLMSILYVYIGSELDGDTWADMFFSARATSYISLYSDYRHVRLATT